MKLKLLAPALAIALVALSVSGCGKKEPAPQAAATKAPTVMKFDEAALFEFDKAELKAEG